METHPPNLDNLLLDSVFPILTLGNAFNSASKIHASGALATRMLGTESSLFEVVCVILLFFVVVG